MSFQRDRIFIEATPLLSEKMSGVGHVLLETVRALDTLETAKTYDIALFVPWNERKKMNRYDFTYLKIKTVPYHHKFFSLFARMRWSPPIDIFLGKGIYIFPNYRNWPLLRSRSITYIHDVCFALHPDFVEEKNLKFLKNYMPLWLKRTNHISTVSKSSKKEIIEQLNVPADVIKVIPNAIDSTKFFPQPVSSVDAIRKKYDLTSDYVLYLGNIEPRKNLETLIEAFMKSNYARSRELFIVGGDGWRNESVYKAIDTAKQNGYRVKKNEHYVPDEDLPALLSGATVLVQPSWHEGFGLAVLQAIACGTPVICSDIPSLHEAAQGHQDSVRFFAPDAPAELTLALDTPMTHPKDTPITLPQWKDSAAQLLRVIEELNPGGKNG